MNFLQFEERFQKEPFSRRISVDGRPNHKNETSFENFSGEVLVAGPKKMVYSLSVYS